MHVKSTLNYNSNASVYIDLFRGIAAIYVVVFHIRPTLFVGSEDIINSNILIKLLYFLTSIGYQFVMVFFVLSGFLISSTVLKMIQENRWSWRDYLFNRLVRLWIVLIPALFLTYIWEKIGVHFLNENAFYKGEHSWDVLLGNIFFLQGIYFENYGFNHPLWSLSFEFWYYILFPCIILSFRSDTLRMKFLYGGLSIAMSVFLGLEIMLYFLVWLLGTLILFLPYLKFQGNRVRSIFVILSLLLMIFVFIAAKVIAYKLGFGTNKLLLFPLEFCSGLSFASVLYILVNFFNKDFVSSKISKLSRLLASFSYTLYLTHFPVLMVLGSLVGHQSWQPDLFHFVLGLVTLSGLLLYAWLISLVTEVKTSKLKEVLKFFLNQKSQFIKRLISS